MTIDVPKDQALALLTDMIRVRRFEEKCAEMYQLGKIRGFLHLYVGEEAVGVGAMHALRETDHVVATYREHAHALLRGVSMESAMAEMFGKATGCSRGRGGSMHLFSVPNRFWGGHAIVGGGLPVAAGLALAEKMRGGDAVVACFFGDGASEEGTFHETMNLASLWKLPVLFLCENNFYAMGTSLARHAADTNLTDRALGYAMQADAVDGMDVLAVQRAVHFAAESVRDEGRPRFLELRTYRFRAHSMYDAEKYRDKTEVAEWAKRDPIETFALRMREAGQLDDLERQRIEAVISDEVQEAVARADDAPVEPIADLTKDVLTEVAR